MSNVRIAIRQLARAPGFSVLAVTILALGIGANSAIFSIVNAVLLAPLPFPHSERLVTLWESDPAQGVEQEQVSPPTFEDWRREAGVFEALGYWTGPFDLNFVTGEGSDKVQGCYASASLFDVLGIEPRLGRTFVPEEDQRDGPQVAVISQRMWQERFGADPQVLGRTVTIDTYGRRTYSIVGVMPASFSFPGNTEIWIAAGWNGLPRERRAGHWLNVVGRLKAGVPAEQARAEMNRVQAGIYRDFSTARVGSEVSIVPLLDQLVGKDARTALFVLWGVVAGVLLIACVNVANLMLARSLSRQREIAVRLALGAGRARVLWQILTESLVLALAGGALGTLVGFWGTKLIVAASPAGIPRLADATMNGAVLAFTMAAAVLTGILFGLAPAWQCSRQPLVETLKEGSRGAAGGRGAARTRSGLVIAQVALATLLLAAAGLMLKSFSRLIDTDRGFEPERVVTAELDFSVSGYTTWIRPTATRPQVRLRELLERLRALPGVQSAGASYKFFREDNRPASQTFFIRGWADGPESQRPTAEHNAITPGYLRSLGIELLRGRDFTEADQIDSPGVAIVNESFARRFFPNGDALGQHVTLERAAGPLDSTNRFGQSVWSEIIGVARDTKSLTLQPEAEPEIFRPYWQWPMQNPTMFVRTTGDPAALVAAIRRETKAVIPNLPAPKIRLLEERVSDSLAQPRFQSTLLALFGALALTLAATGIYGVISYGVTQRRREVGVRMALGAQRRDVLALVMGGGMKLACAGVLIGVVAALALFRFVTGWLYGVPPWDPPTFLAVTALLVLVAAGACSIPALRATRTNPTEALRYE